MNIIHDTLICPEGTVFLVIDSLNDEVRLHVPKGTEIQVLDVNEQDTRGEPHSRSIEDLVSCHPGYTCERVNFSAP